MAVMKKEFVDVFVKGALAYLEHIPNVDISIGSPYLITNNQKMTHDITGIISVHGVLHGKVYFTAPRIFLSHILALMGEKDLSKSNLLDLSGEIANTISGNARSGFGSDFIISVPTVIDGPLEGLDAPHGQRSFAIPIVWNVYTSLLIVSLE